ncbi:MAG: multi-sensor signal transduction histidine [Desulfobulbaceae bacterium]|nr:MAG: multi-sensor signal transduction histidine [Desulfobulbaceae bacterium]
MSAQEDFMAETELRARLKAQEKTIEALMDTVERQSSGEVPSLELLSQNLNLERVVQRKTETLRQQGEELQQALHDLQLTQTQLLQANKLESVGQLAAGIAHEINTPVQFIGTNIEFLKESFQNVKRLVDVVEEQIRALSEGADIQRSLKALTDMLAEIDWDYLSEELPTAIGQSQDGIHRITKIVQAMKEFSHPSSKEKVKNDLNKLIDTTVIVATNEWKYVADVRTEFDPELPLVCCLADELGQVVLNILVNAAHAIESKLSSDPQKKKGTITISTRHDQQHVVIRIADTGSGIPKEIQGRVFDPFFTTKVVGKGTGQGLAIAHDVVTQKHGGTLNLETEPGKGTVFIIRLPIE